MPPIPTTRTHEILSCTEDNLREVRHAEFARLDLARAWAMENVVTDPDQLADPRRRPTVLGAVGLPVDEYAASEFAAALELHPLAGRAWMADGVDLHERLPDLWQSVAAGRVEVWVARKIAAATRDLSEEKARWVDTVISGVVGTLPAGRLLSLVAARVVEADQALAERKAEQAARARTVWMSRSNEHGTRALMVRGTSDGVLRLDSTITQVAHLLEEHGTPEQRSLSADELRADAAELLANPLAVLKLMVGVEESTCPEQVAEAIREAGPAKTRPRAVVYLHMTRDSLLGGGVVRAEELGALTRQQLIDVLGHHQVSLRPVIDLDQGMAADCYEVPAAIDERLQLAKPADVFPFASSMSRHLDRDHTVPYDDTGPPGQTTEEKLGKLTRHHHRIKTHGGWQVRQDDRRFTWTTPHGRTYVTDGNGTRRWHSGARAIDVIWAGAVA